MTTSLTPEQIVSRDILLDDYRNTSAQLTSDQKALMATSARRRELGQRLNAEYGMTKVALAKAAGISETAVYQMLQPRSDD